MIHIDGVPSLEDIYRDTAEEVLHGAALELLGPDKGWESIGAPNGEVTEALDLAAHELPAQNILEIGSRFEQDKLVSSAFLSLVERGILVEEDGRYRLGDTATEELGTDPSMLMAVDITANALARTNPRSFKDAA